MFVVVDSGSAHIPTLSYTHPPRHATMHVQAAAASKRAVEEKAAFGTFASDGGKTYTYREQKGGTYGSYKVVSVALDGSKTREELLELRSKVKSDKYC